MPKEWAWCRLGELFYHTTGKALKKSNNKGSLRKYITTSNLYWNKFDFTEVREMYFTNDELDKCTIKKGDLVLCNGGDVGRAAIWNFDEDICYQNHVSRLRPKIIGINNKLYLYLLMFYKEQGMLNGKGVGITSLSANDLLSGLFPLPPINEQDQIVIKIENIFSQIDYIDDNKSDLQTAINKTKSKILDLVIHGKLVPQDPNDEPAEELLKRISTSDNRPYKKIEEEEPYELPSNWSWCYLCDICSKIKRGKSPKYTDKSTIMAFAQKCNQKDGPTSLEKALYIDESSLKKYQEDEKMQFNDIVINSTGTGTLGRVGIFNCPIPDDVNAVYPDSHVTTVRILPEIDKLYCYYFIKNKQSYLETMGEGSTNQKELKPDTISSLYFPLPPYSEQLRIVSKIEELFSYLDKISFNLE